MADIGSVSYVDTTTVSPDNWTGEYVQDDREWVRVPSPNSTLYALYEKEEVKDMRGLFHIVVVEYKTDKILQDGLVIAKDRETAKIKALAPFADAHDLDDLDAVCNKLGDVRKKREVQKVTIVEGGE